MARDQHSLQVRHNFQPTPSYCREDPRYYTVRSKTLYTDKRNASGCKFDVKYDNLEALEKNETTLLQAGCGGGGGASEDEAKQMVSLFGRMTISGSFRPPDENRINDKFPRLRQMTAEELLTMAWAGK